MFKFLKMLTKLYSAKKFLGYFGSMGRRLTFMREAVILFFCLKDSRTPMFVRLCVAGAIGYLITPTDILPDFITGIGWLDDAAVIAGAMRLADKYILPEHVAKAKKFFPN